MSIKFHKLDFINDEKFFLIALHSNVEIFFLAYLLNKNLKTSFKKMKYNVINNENNYLFERYQSVDKNKREKMDLFSNKSALKKNQTADQVFSLFDSSYFKKFFFIDEFKDVDFFIKKDSINNLDLLIKKIKLIEEIESSYLVDEKLLKNKENLIFD
ncbi:MAG: IPExxxVDY family protein [Bacteroidota bacterium]|nr:IPExxxVDY family protein [Bacteroidota bacterium]